MEYVRNNSSFLPSTDSAQGHTRKHTQTRTHPQKNIPEEQRLCELCDLQEVDNESHFHLYCPFCDELRVPFVNELFAQNPEIFWSNDVRMECLFTFNVYKLASFVTKAWMKRQDG